MINDYSGYVDSKSTFPEWNQNTSGILIQPVGSLEQHSYHLPVGTDTFLAEHFARKAAEELEAALLPPLSVCTSYEHRGFRGSFSFRPETVTGIIRDIADDAERQNFSRLIIVNYHGGNFILGPVSREINSLNRPLKIIIAAPYTFCGRKPGELHAGEIETSLMAYLFPELVRAERHNVDNERWLENQITREDLNTFGIGTIADKGAAGFPEKAARELGRDLEKEITGGFLPWLRERLGMLRKQPFYQGAGGVTIRRLQPSDIDRCMELKNAAGWNQTHRDWRILIDLSPRVADAAVYNGGTVGTITAVEYGNTLAWIGMVLVDPEHRRRGIATRLLENSLYRLKDFPAVGLDATLQGAPLYEKLGFIARGKINRMELTGEILRNRKDPVPKTAGTRIRPMLPEDMERLAPLDLPGFGYNRLPLLKAWYTLAPGKPLICENDSGLITAFCFARPGTTYWQIGPLNAPNEETALIILSSMLAALPAGRIVLDVPEGHGPWEDAVREIGFQRTREFTRMLLGDPERIGPGEPEWLIAGPEFG